MDILLQPKLDGASAALSLQVATLLLPTVEYKKYETGSLQ
jgi:hypothetical protein